MNAVETEEAMPKLPERPLNAGVFSRIDIDSWIKQQSTGKPERAMRGTSHEGERK